MTKYLTLLIIPILILVSCSEDNPNLMFLGSYTAECNGDLNIASLIDTTFTNELASVTISAGPGGDDIFIYVELNSFVDQIGPLGVQTTATVSGNEYTAQAQALSLVGGLTSFTVSATGTLSEDGTSLISTVTFQGGISGVITCNGTKL